MFNIYIGLRGSGKTSHAAYVAHKYLKQGYKVYSNVPIMGTIQYSVEDLGRYNICNGILIFDEAGIDLSNRSYMKKGSSVNSKEFLSFWKLSRHYHIDDIYVYSQAWDFEVILRRLADRMFIVSRGLLPHFTHLNIVRPNWDVDDDGQPVIKWNISGLPRIFFRMPYYKYFDSYSCEQLPDKYFEEIPISSLHSSKFDKFIIYKYKAYRGIKHFFSNIKFRLHGGGKEDPGTIPPQN